MLLDCDSYIFIEGELIEFKIGSLSHVSERPSPWGSVDGLETDMDIPMGHKEVDDDSHVLVQQSHPQELPRRGSADLAYLTPAVAPETILEEPGVQETPSVRSRFLNPDSATVTLPRTLPREDTFGELTPRRNKPLFPSTGLVFGGHGDDVDLSTSEDEEQEIIQSSRFFKTVPVEPNSVESTADEELPEASTEGVAGMIASTTSTVLLPRWPDGGKENRESGAEDMRRQFSEAPMITSFTAGSVGASKETSPAAEEESDRKRKESKDSDMPTRPMKQGVPEGFLYEEHKKDVTPKQTYGKNRRTPRAKPKGKRVEMDKEIERAISEDGLKQGRHGRSAKSGNGEGNRGTQETDESEEKEPEISSRRRGSSFHAHGGEDTIMETADDEEGQDIAPPARARGRRGMMTVQSQPDSTANTTEVELGSGRLSGGKKIPSSDLESGELNVGEKKAGSALTPNPTRLRRGTMKVSDASGTTMSATTKSTRSTRKRRRTPEDADQESLAGDNGGGDIHSPAESVIHVSREPRSKRAKTTPSNKPAAKTPTGRRGGKGITPTPPLDNSEKLLGDTQYTFPDVSQTQAMDRVEVKTPTKTPKKTLKTAKKKTVSSTKKPSTAPSTKTEKELTEEERLVAEEAEEAGEEKTRTRDRYDGDSPKIVFSNSGLDGRKVRTFRPWLIGFTDLEQDIEKFLRANGGKKIQNVSAPGVNFLVVGPGELKRTPKFTISVALGKWIVEDQWLIDSKEVGYFLDPDPYIPHDPTHEKAWSFSLRTAIARGRNGENNILEEHTIYITPALLAQVKAFKQEESLIEMLKTTGAGSIIRKAPKGRKEDDENGDKTLILGAEKGDNDVVGLEKLGWNVYGTGIVAVSVLRGRLEVGEKEFRIMPGKEGTQTLGRGRKGK